MTIIKKIAKILLIVIVSWIVIVSVCFAYAYHEVSTHQNTTEDIVDAYGFTQTYDDGASADAIEQNSTIH